MATDVLASFSAATKAAQPTRPEKLAAFAAQTKAVVPQTVVNLINSRNQTFRQIWNNPNFDPDEILNAMGDAAKSVVDHDVALCSFLAERLTAAKVPDEAIAGMFARIPDGWTLSYPTHEDGTLTGFVVATHAA